MREYFTQLLNNLESLTGMKQLERISQKPNAAAELNNLLDILCRVCDLFPFIPEEAKKNIISDSVVTDQDFIGLNAKVIYKWLNLRKDIYYKEIAHIEAQNQPEPVTGEKRDEWLKIWTQELDKISDNFYIKPLSNAEIMREKMLGNQAEPTHYKSNEQKGKAKLLHMEYIRTNYSSDGNCLETWLPEDEWMKKQFPEPIEGVTQDDTNPKTI